MISPDTFFRGMAQMIPLSPMPSCRACPAMLFFKEQKNRIPWFLF